MSADQSSVNQNQLLFSNLEWLQQLREQLSFLIDEPKLNSQQLFEEFYQQASKIFSVTDQNQQQTRLRQTEFLKQFFYQSGERLNQIQNLATLTIKMIDYICQKQLNHNQIIEKYEQQVDQLRNTIQFLTRKNQFIQNDVQIFKKQLQGAQHELLQICQLKKEQKQSYLQTNRQQNMIKGQQKDQKIRNLQQQLLKLKKQLQILYSSFHNIKQFPIYMQNTSVKRIKTDRFSPLRRQQIDIAQLQQELQKSSKRICELQKQNKFLKSIVYQFQQSKFQTQQAHLSKDHTFENVNEFLGQSLSITTVENNLFMIQRESFQKPLANHESFIIPLINKQSNQFRQISSPNSLYEQRQKGQMIQISCSLQNSDNNKFRALNSDCSSRSFQIDFNNFKYENISSPKLITSNQEKDYTSHKKTVQIVASTVSSPKIAQQTRQTQHSVKQFQHRISKFQKFYCSTGTNTTNLMQKKEQFSFTNIILQKIGSNYVYNFFCNLIIEKRINRSKTKAKSIMGRFIY